MAFVPWTNGAQAILQWASGIGTWTNRLAFSKLSFNYQDMVDLSGAIETGLRTAYKGFLATTVTFYGVDVIDMRVFGAQSYVSPYAGAPGLDIRQVLPSSLSVVATLRTAGRGRAFRGRTYLAGFTEEYLNSGIWDVALTGEVVSQMEAWQAAAVTEGWTLCVATEMINHVPQSPAVLTPVTSIEVRSAIPGHQRRRDRRP